MLNIRQIEAFRAAIETGTVSRAAEARGDEAHPEPRAGDRPAALPPHAGRVSPTAEAMLLFDEVERIFKGLASLESFVGEIRTLHHGHLRVGRDLAELPLSAASMELWYDLAGLLGDDGGFRVSAHVRVAEDEADMTQLETRAATVRARGFTHEELLTRTQLRELVPALAEHCVGGLVPRRDGFATPYRATLAFARAARALGVTIIEGTRAAAIDRSARGWSVATAAGRRLSATHLLNTAGAWGHRVANALGERVPLAFAPYMITVTSRLAPFVRPVVIGTGRPLSFKQVENGSVVIGGGYTGGGDLDGGLIRVGVEAIAHNVRTAAELFRPRSPAAGPPSKASCLTTSR